MTWSITSDDSPEMGMSADEVEIPFTLASAINLEEVTSDHARLTNLDFANSGHTGFQAAISDLETIRSGAAAGATALQEVPSTYRTSAAQDVIDEGKQDSLTAAQLAAANSGITAAKVAAAKVYTFTESDGYITIAAEAL